MSELRPHVAAEAFVDRVHQQQSEGYRLVALSESGRVLAVAGFRIGHCLAWGKFLYVDDLVTADASRSSGHGARLLDWLVQKARAEGCDQFHLDSGNHRGRAHAFYEREGLEWTSRHYVLTLRETVTKLVL